MTKYALVFCATFGLAACAEDTIIQPELAPGGSLQLRPEIVRMTVGGTSRLQAVAFDAAGSPVFTGALTWSTPDGDVVSVGSDGVVTALEAGWGRVVAHSATGQADTAFIAAGMLLSDVSVGIAHACSRTATGEAYCWGGGDVATRGALGTGAVPASFTPARVSGDLSFTELQAGGTTTCGLAGGNAYCWGSAQQSAVGAACPQVNQGCHAPVRVTMRTFEHLSVSTAQFTTVTCASGTTGVTCWGRGPVMLDVNGCLQGCSPRVLSDMLTGDVAVGVDHACALDAGGRAFCWGSSANGKLGTELSAADCANTACSRSNKPVPVATDLRFSQLAAGNGFTCGLTAAGQAICWGTYHTSVPGAPGTLPVQVAGDLRFNAIDAGTGHVCALTAAGALYCWGANAYTGALGAPLLGFDAVDLVPRRIGGTQTFRSVSTGNQTTCAVTTEGGGVCLGSGFALGQGVAGKSSMPLPVAPPGPIPDYIATSSATSAL